jgi:hypothetical protein
MLRTFLAVLALILSRGTSVSAQTCNEAMLRSSAETARDNIIAAIDGAEAIRAWRHVLANDGAVVWTVTEYNVDARSTFVFAFDRDALRVYRAGALGAATDAAMRGCLDPAVAPEAIVPWRDVREIEAANWVVRFRLRTPIEIRSDRGKRQRVSELKAYFHGAGGGDLTYYYNANYVGRIPFWNMPVYEIENLRGIAVGPTAFQRRLQFVLATAVDPEHRITLKQKGRGAGW